MLVTTSPMPSTTTGYPCLLVTTSPMPSKPTGYPYQGRLLCAPPPLLLPPAYPAAVNELVEDLGHAWCIIQKHQALADHCVVGLRTVLIQADQQLQHLWRDIDHTNMWLPLAYAALPQELAAACLISK